MRARFYPGRNPGRSVSCSGDLRGALPAPGRPDATQAPIKSAPESRKHCRISTSSRPSGTSTASTTGLQFKRLAKKWTRSTQPPDLANVDLPAGACPNLPGTRRTTPGRAAGLAKLRHPPTRHPAAIERGASAQRRSGQSRRSLFSEAPRSVTVRPETDMPVFAVAARRVTGSDCRCSLLGGSGSHARSWRGSRLLDSGFVMRRTRSASGNAYARLDPPSTIIV